MALPLFSSLLFHIPISSSATLPLLCPSQQLQISLNPSTTIDYKLGREGTYLVYLCMHCSSFVLPEFRARKELIVLKIDDNGLSVEFTRLLRRFIVRHCLPL